MESVQPQIFDRGDGTSVKIFLKDYEDYFEQKYNGNERQCARQLELGAAHDALDTKNLSYI